MEYKKGQTVYITRENKKISNPPRSGVVHSVHPDHVVLKTKGGTGVYKVHKDDISSDRKDDWMTKKYPEKGVNEDVPTNSVGGGDVSGIGVDKPGKEGSGQPGVYRKVRKSLKQYMKGN